MKIQCEMTVDEDTIVQVGLGILVCLAIATLMFGINSCVGKTSSTPTVAAKSTATAEANKTPEEIVATHQAMVKAHEAEHTAEAAPVVIPMGPPEPTVKLPPEVVTGSNGVLVIVEPLQTINPAKLVQ